MKMKKMIIMCARVQRLLTIDMKVEVMALLAYHVLGYLTEPRISSADLLHSLTDNG